MKKHIPNILIIYICFVFIQSLFFKFTNAPETQYIFETINSWVLSLGLPALFLPPFIPGIFNQYVIGSVELLASLLLLTGVFLANAKFKTAGALIALGVISGAILFHLFTPLGVVVKNDGGTLFVMACGVFVASIYTVYLNFKACCTKKI